MRVPWYRPGHRGVLAIAMLALVTQISCSSGSPLRVSDDHLIVPDTRIGPFKLGMTDQELFQVGTPSGTKQMLGIFNTYWFNDRAVYVNTQSRRVEWIFTENNSDRTSSGIGVGSSVEDLFRAFGPPYRTVEETCGQPRGLESVLYQGGDVLLGFSPSNATCVDAPTKRVQYLMIKTPAAKSFD